MMPWRAIVCGEEHPVCRWLLRYLMGKVTLEDECPCQSRRIGRLRYAAECRSVSAVLGRIDGDVSVSLCASAIQSRSWISESRDNDDVAGAGRGAATIKIRSSTRPGGCPQATGSLRRAQLRGPVDAMAAKSQRNRALAWS